MPELEPDRVDLVVESYLRYLEEGGTPPSLQGLSDDEKAEAEAIFRVLKASWGVDSFHPPKLEDDPTARMLGLVGRAPKVLTICGSAVRAARKAQRLDVDAVAARLAALGHSVDTWWAFNLEQNESMEMDSKLAEDLAELLATPLSQLTASIPTRRQGSLEAFLASSSFRSRMERWAKTAGMRADQAIAWASRELAMAPQRSQGQPGEEEWHRMLTALLEAKAKKK